MNKEKIKLLQKKYEMGQIKEEEISEMEKESLLLLYKEQIEFLEDGISKYNKQFQEHKKRIMKLKR